MFNFSENSGTLSESEFMNTKQKMKNNTMNNTINKELMAME